MVTSPGLPSQEADVRELLEVIRERAQLAVLQYGLLGVAFTSLNTRIPLTPTIHEDPAHTPGIRERPGIQAS